MARDLLPYAVPAVLLLLGAYVYFLAIRSREADLTRALRKCEVAREDAERSLQSASMLHEDERRRLRALRRETESPGDDAKFRRAKAVFARLFHPDSILDDATEREIRTEIFKQYWDELERIDRD